MQSIVDEPRDFGEFQPLAEKYGNASKALGAGLSLFARRAEQEDVHLSQVKITVAGLSETDRLLIELIVQKGYVDYKDGGTLVVLKDKGISKIESLASSVSGSFSVVRLSLPNLAGLKLGSLLARFRTGRSEK